MTDPNITFDERVQLAQIARELDLDASREWARDKITRLAVSVLDVRPFEVVWMGETVQFMPEHPVARVGSALLTLNAGKGCECDLELALIQCWSCATCSAVVPLRPVLALADLARNVPQDRDCLPCQFERMVTKAVAIPGSRERHFRRIRRVLRRMPRYALVFVASAVLAAWLARVVLWMVGQ